MTDPNRVFRIAVYQALNGNLTDIDGNPVGIFDEVAENPGNAYVLLSTQTSSQRGTFNGFLHDCTILLQIIDKETIFVTKEFIDDIGTKIMQILMPNQADGLVQQTGFQINCLQVESMNSNDAQLTDSTTIVRKLLRLSAKICQT